MRRRAEARKALNVRLTPETREKLDAFADQRGISINQATEELLGWALANVEEQIQGAQED